MKLIYSNLDRDLGKNKRSLLILDTLCSTTAPYTVVKVVAAWETRLQIVTSLVHMGIWTFVTIGAQGATVSTTVEFTRACWATGWGPQPLIRSNLVVTILAGLAIDIVLVLSVRWYRRSIIKGNARVDRRSVAWCAPRYQLFARFAALFRQPEPILTHTTTLRVPSHIRRVPDTCTPLSLRVNL